MLRSSMFPYSMLFASTYNIKLLTLIIKNKIFNFFKTKKYRKKHNCISGFFMHWKKQLCYTALYEIVPHYELTRLFRFTHFTSLVCSESNWEVLFEETLLTNYSITIAKHQLQKIRQQFIHLQEVSAQTIGLFQQRFVRPATNPVGSFTLACSRAPRSWTTDSASVTSTWTSSTSSSTSVRSSSRSCTLPQLLALQ